jgi:hypothetical protein
MTDEKRPTAFLLQIHVDSPGMRTARDVAVALFKVAHDIYSDGGGYNAEAVIIDNKKPWDKVVGWFQFQNWHDEATCPHQQMKADYAHDGVKWLHRWEAEK